MTGLPARRFLVDWTRDDGLTATKEIQAESHRQARRRFWEWAAPIYRYVHVDRITVHPDDRTPGLPDDGEEEVGR